MNKMYLIIYIALILLSDVVMADINTPIQISLNMSKMPTLNEIGEITAKIVSTEDALNTSVEIVLPPGCNLVKGDVSKKINLKADLPEYLNSSVRFTQSGDFQLMAMAVAGPNGDRSGKDSLDLKVGENESRLTTPRLVRRLMPIANETKEVSSNAIHSAGATEDIQVTLMWQSHVDLDIYVTDPQGDTVWYGNTNVPSGGFLDRDNMCGNFVMGEPENVVWNENMAPTGTYNVQVKYFSDCGNNVGSVNWNVRVTIKGQEAKTYYGTINTVKESQDVCSFDFGADIKDFKVSGGLSKYEGDLKGIVFRRGEINPSPYFEVDATLSPVDRVVVDIYRAGSSILIDPLETKSKPLPGKYGVSWNWNSRTWSTIPGDIPVGEYKAKAKIISKDGIEIACSEEKVFFVIFNDQGIDGYFTQGSTGFNYYGGFEYPEPIPDLGSLVSYSLHIFDPKIFEAAIGSIEGQTSPRAAADNLRSRVTAMIDYSKTSVNPTRSTLYYDPVTSKNGQCMDYANLLTSYLRTIGLSSRPITTTDIDGWNFHAWTECWLPEAGSNLPNDYWAVLDSTDGADYESDSVIPHNYWTNHKSDFDSNEWWWWCHSRVYTSDSSSSRIDARDVHYEFASAALAQEGSDNCSIMIYPLTDKSKYIFGEDVTLNIEFENIGNTSHTNTYDVSVAKYSEMSKGLSTNESTHILEDIGNVTIPEGSSINLSYLLSQSDYTDTGHYIACARIDEECIGFAEFDIIGGLNISISKPSAVDLDTMFNISLEIKNILTKSINNITVDAYLPPDSEFTGSTNFNIPMLNPGEVRTATWTMKIFGNDVHNIRITSFSNDSGFTGVDSTIKVLKPAELYVKNKYIPILGEIGTSLDIEFDVENIGDLTAPNVTAAIALPEGVTATETTWTIGDLSSGEKALLHTIITPAKAEDIIIDVYATEDTGINASGIIYLDLPSMLYYPDFTDTSISSSWRSWLVLHNPATSAAEVNLDIRSRSGYLLYQGSQTIAAGSVAAIRPRDLAGSDCSGSVVLSSNQTLVGSCEITRNDNQMSMSYNAFDKGSETLYYPDFTDTSDSNSWRSWLVIQNPTNSAADINLEFRSRAGDLLYSGNATIPAHGVSALRPRNLIGSDCAGSATVTSNQSITGTCQITRNNNLMCMSYNAFYAGSTPIYYPDFTDSADPNSWRSWLVIHNPATFAINIDLDIRSRAGDLLYSGNQTIPAHGVAAIRPRNLVGSDISGSVMVTSNQPIVGTCQINRNNNLMCMSYNALDSVSLKLFYPDFTDTTNPNSWRSWLVLQNPAASEANITLEIRSRAGGLLYSGSQIIPAQGVAAIRPRNLVGSDCSGSVVVTSNQPIVGACQINRNNNLMCMSYTAIE